ncbi:ATP-binding cassette domain-containing protein [Nakamurella lactea]|uniref:ATP-binding cassette domain-containing protein n=1 Tax=Nakamurella lactea TaxID=459515 RepID=UPI0004153C93|nr:ATP-binding cassette domain-containing protein [Nakamurella lactea]
MQKTPVLVTNGSIEISQLSYRYPGPSDEHCALLGVSFTVEPGEFVVLHGVSGSGKSTLLAILAGLLIPVEGVVQCAGVDLTTTDSDQRAHYRATRSAVVFQEFNLLTMLTVAENVGLRLD